MSDHSEFLDMPSVKVYTHITRVNTRKKHSALEVILSLLVSLLGTVILLCVVFPVYWVTRVTDEGIEGLGITGRNLPLAVIFSLLLCLWRFSEIREFIGQPFFISSILFNALSIWEVLFIFGWLYTRYKRSFRELPAILLTSLSVGIYHIGTLETDRIISLCVVIIVCGVFYGITNSIFTVWPIYWAVGCSASTLSSSMRFSMEIGLSGCNYLFYSDHNNSITCSAFTDPENYSQIL